jgi:hypothetical protein
MGGTSLSYFHLKQLPLLPPDSYDRQSVWSPDTTQSTWLLHRVLELTYTAWDLQAFALECGYDGPPFRWDESRRFLLRCELDAAFFHLYAINRDDTAYILDTFAVVRKKDEAAHGEYRTQRVILEIYDRMADAIKTGDTYVTAIDPLPGPPAEGLPEWPPGHAMPHNWPIHIHPPRPDQQAKVRPDHDVHRLQTARIVSYIILLLREWQKPATRSSLEAALVLMLNDEARAQIISQPPTVVDEPAQLGLPQFVQGLDGLLGQLQTTGLIQVETTKRRQVIRIGPKARDTSDAPSEDIVRLRQTLEAFRIVGEDRASDIIPLFVTARYELVS